MAKFTKLTEELTVKELISLLEKVEDKDKIIEIPSFGTFDEYDDVEFIEEKSYTVRLG